MKNRKGSEWRRWDMHIHVPTTILANKYAHRNIDLFCSKIEELTDIKVIGITDYYVTDGIKEILNEYKNNRMKNIEYFIPNIEVRLQQTTRNGQHINFHILCNPEKLDDIEENILTKLEFSYNGQNYFMTKNSLIRLGKAINMGNYTSEEDDLIKGVNAFKVNTVNLLNLLNSNPNLRDDIILGVSNSSNDGNSGWADKDVSEAIRDELYRLSDVIFSARPKDKDYFFSKEAEKKIGKKPCVNGSDAHKYEKIGVVDSDKSLWIKANPSFCGLRQILNEPEDRVYIGEKPEVLKRYDEDKTNFIEKLIIRKKNENLLEKKEWFDDIEIEFNKELVTIIGNKGKGKSAIADIIGLIGNSKNYENFNFLQEKKFKNHNGKLSKMYEAKLVRGGGIENKKCLHDPVNFSEEEVVKYIPQSFFEELTNEIDDKFERELNNVIFSHLVDERQLFKDFEDLKEKKTKAIFTEIDSLKIKLKEKNMEIKKLEEKKHESYKESIESKKKILEDKLSALEKPKEVLKNIEKNTAEQAKIEGVKKEIEICEVELENLSNNHLLELKKEEELQEIKEKIKIFSKSYLELIEELSKSDYIKTNDLDSIIKLEYDLAPVNLELEKVNSEKIEINKLKEIKQKEKELKEEVKKNLFSKLIGQDRLYEEYKQNMEKYEKLKKDLEGDETKKDTIKFYNCELDYLKNILDKDILQKKKERKKIVIDIFQKKEEEIEIYKKIKGSIQKVMDDNCLEILGSKLSLDVDYKLTKNFYDNFFDYINSGRKGHYRGNESGKEYLLRNITFDIEEAKDIEKILKKIEESFEKKDGEELHIHDQIKAGKILDFYNFLYSLDYLKPSYSLKMDRKDLTELSPGEKGALLLIFYLLLDSSNIPLIMDQPEDNLDNQSVYSILVSYIKKAKSKRQIIMITHNPNLAVVSDSEQIIYVDMDKQNNNKVSIISGAIEDKQIKGKIIEILEGTMPAFENRTLKYKL